MLDKIARSLVVGGCNLLVFGFLLWVKPDDMTYDLFIKAGVMCLMVGLTFFLVSDSSKQVG